MSNRSVCEQMMVYFLKRRDQMKAIVIREPGGSETLSYEELPDPEPGPGEVLDGYVPPV